MSRMVTKEFGYRGIGDYNEFWNESNIARLPVYLLTNITFHKLQCLKIFSLDPGPNTN